MLTRKCQKSIGRLTSIGDSNVSMTIVGKKKSRFVQKSFIDRAWTEALMDAIGHDIINDSENTYLVSCQTEQEMADFSTEGDLIIHQCWKHLHNVDVVRIDITKFPTSNNKLRSFIIARD